MAEITVVNIFSGCEMLSAAGILGHFESVKYTIPRQAWVVQLQSPSFNCRGTINVKPLCGGASDHQASTFSAIITIVIFVCPNNLILPTIRFTIIKSH